MRGPRARRHPGGGGVLALTGRLLVLRALGLGDFLTGLPALRAVRRAEPGRELVLAAPAALAPLVRLAGAVDDLLDTRGLAPLPWTAEPPAMAVNLHGRGPQSHRVLRAVRPARLVAFGCAEAGYAGPAWRAEEHEVRRWCRLVEEALGVPGDPTELALGAPGVAAPDAGAVVVHPGAAYPSRRWPADRFAAVAGALAADGHRVVVTGGPGERALAERVTRDAGLPGRACLAGRTDLEALAAQVAAAPLVVCGDTGVAHLASAYGTPSVLLFGPTAPDRWGPPPGPHVVLWHGDGTGDPWGEDTDPALLRIGVEEVLAAARSVRRVAGRPGASKTGLVRGS